VREPGASDVAPSSGAAPALGAAGDAWQAASFLDTIVENVPHVLFVKEAEGLRFVRVNRAAEALLSIPREAILGRTAYDLFPEARARAIEAHDREVLAGRAVVVVAEEQLVTPGGTRWLHTTKIPLFGPDGAPAFLVGIGQDVTEPREMRARLREAHEELEQRVLGRTAQLLLSNEDLKREIHERKQAEAALRSSEERLRHAQKMEAIGRLAGGVAHDFNNLLSVIIGYAQLILGGRPEGDATGQLVKEILAAGTRASQLTRQLLALGRKGVLRPRVLDLNEVLRDEARMLRRIIREDIEIQVVTAHDLALSRLDPTQVEQVVMNLVVNARDAMPGGGRVTLETRNVRADEDFARAHPGLSPGRYVMLSVTDTGVGMDAATKARVFEPFFTTKEDGRGTGLGLSTAFGIVEQSGGAIWVESEPGRGSTFVVYFPATEELPEAPRVPDARPHAKAGETILLVEDEPQVRGMVKAVLVAEGYAVLEAATPSDAIVLSERFLGTIHLLLTDVVMPAMRGPELARILATSRPAMKVLFVSGYDDALDGSGVPPGAPVLHKPLAIDELAARLRETLASA